MLRSEKVEMVAALEAIYKKSSSVIVTHYHGLKVSDITELRKSLRNQGGGVKIVKNTLSKIAAKNALAGDLSSLLNGPSALIFSEDPMTAVREVVKLAKTNDKLKIIGGVVDNQILNVEDVQTLSKLPSLNELRGKIIGLLQAPASRIATVVNAPASGLARLFNAYANK